MFCENTLRIVFFFLRQLSLRNQLHGAQKQNKNPLQGNWDKLFHVKLGAEENTTSYMRYCAASGL